jgi:HD-GYP domain-containing protein (c-di-GMP phosphodiesterase class II)
MIKDFHFLKNAGRVILFHHESYDGRGYPHGLAGEDIPIEARLFSVADTLDAITSDRPYRKGQSFQEAFREVEKGREIQFDPNIVDAFFSVPKERWQTVKFETKENFRLYTIH